MLERHVHVRDEAGRGRHEVQDRVVERLRVRVEEPDPGEPRLAEEPLDELREPGPTEAEVLAVSRRVLGDQHELRDALPLERGRLGDERLDRPAPLLPAHLRDRAERAGVVAALAHFQVRVAPPLREHSGSGLVVESRRERLVGEPRKGRQAGGRFRRALELVQADEGVHLGDLRRELAPVLLHHAARDDDAVDLPPPLALHLLEDRVDRLFLGAVDEAARVDEDDSRGGVRHDLVARPLEVAEHDLGIHEVLRAPERDDADDRRRLRLSAHG